VGKIGERRTIIIQVFNDVFLFLEIEQDEIILYILHIYKF
jgi:hypothetical protein